MPKTPPKKNKAPAVQTPAPLPVKRPTSLTDLSNACFKLHTAKLLAGNEQIEIEWRLLNDEEFAALDIIVNGALPPVIKVDGEDRFDFSDPEYAKNSKILQGQAACMAVFWACPVIGRAIPELERSFPALAGTTRLAPEQVNTIVKVVQNALPTLLISQLFALARGEAAEFEKLVGFTLPGA